MRDLLVKPLIFTSKNLMTQMYFFLVSPLCALWVILYKIHQRKATEEEKKERWRMKFKVCIWENAFSKDVQETFL